MPIRSSVPLLSVPDTTTLTQPATSTTPSPAPWDKSTSMETASAVTCSWPTTAQPFALIISMSHLEDQGRLDAPVAKTCSAPTVSDVPALPV